MIRPFKTPGFLRVLYPGRVWRKCSEDAVFLTFDDGPTPEVTPWVVDQLNKVDAKGTFFCIGKKVEKNPNLLNDLISAGHQVGNHSYSHLNAWKCRSDDFIADVSKGEGLLQSFGIESDLFRPPYGRLGIGNQAVVREKKVVMWSHIAWDFRSDLNIAACLKVLGKALPGSILLFHDSDHAFANLKQVLPDLLQVFKERGLKMEALL